LRQIIFEMARAGGVGESTFVFNINLPIYAFNWWLDSAS
jgi:hypothetical protein